MTKSICLVSLLIAVCGLGVGLSLGEPPASHGKPETKAETKTEAKAPAKSDTKSESKPGKPEVKAEAKPDPKTDAKRGEGKSEAKDDGAKGESKSETKPAAVKLPDPPATPDAALDVLRKGNERWAEGRVMNPNTDSARRAALAEQGQHPFATILTCADSRVPAERLFDQGVGDIFVVRVAGNVSATAEAGTIEYGLGHLKTPLLVVMGHSKCGAVAAAASGAELHGKIAELVGEIAPAIARAKRNNPGASGEELARIAVRENVWQSIYDLMKSSDDVRSLVQGGQVRVVGAVYDIASGKVEWMGEHPWQTEILQAMAGEGKPSTREAKVSEHE